MKKHLQIIFLTFFLFTGTILIQAQDWRKAATNTYPGDGINGIYFVNETTGWIAGNYGLILKSTNAGDSWTKVLEDANLINYLEVYFVDENNGFVGGKTGIVKKTADGGANWVGADLPAGVGDIESIFASDANHIWILVDAGTGSKVYHSSDAGSNWQSVLDITQPANAMHFGGPTNGIVVGKTNADLYYTTDGINWATGNKAPLGGFTYSRSDIRGVFMLNSKVAYAVGWGSLVGLQPSIHIVTTDGGVNWNYLTQTQANRTYDNLYCVYFKDENNGVALGGAAKGTLALKTTDGGQNWIPVRFPSGVTIEHISAVGNTVWVTGGGGVIFRTTNFGDNWELLTPIPSVNLYDVQYLTGGIIYAGGFDGLFLKSSNSGNNWIANYVTSGLVTTNVQDIHFINENVGYATQSYGLLSKTTDGGKSWFASIPDTNNASTVIYGVNFVNENLGFAVGKIANGLDMIYKTINGGQKWDMKMNLISGSFRHIDFYNENIGVAVGEKLKAMFTTDGGNTWNNSTFVSLPPGTTTPNLRKVEFRDANNVTAVGDAIILNSTDAGANWNYAPVDNLVETLTGLSFSDQLNGIAVGSKTSTPKSVTILKTTDGAQTWTNITNTDMFLATDVINSVSLNSNYIWICGATSNIFTNEPVTSVFDEENQPEEYYLAQNYPNPFNPATKITFKLEKSSFVSLKIFDVLGREIKTLVNEYRLAGNHELVFDASNLSSGIYLYVLNSTDYSIAKKMTLMK